MKLKEPEKEKKRKVVGPLSEGHHINLKNSVLGLPTLSGLVFVNIFDIVRCESENVYTTFHLADKSKVVVSRVMKECEDRLEDIGFYRVHESHLVNIIHVDEYRKEEGGKLILSDGSSIQMSRRKKSDFLDFINKL